MFYVVSYDISDDRKRTKMAKNLLDFGTRVQYSVFECILDDKRLEALTGLISKGTGEEDNVRVYALCGKCEKTVRIFGSGEVTKDEDVYIL